MLVGQHFVCHFAQLSGRNPLDVLENFAQRLHTAQVERAFAEVKRLADKFLAPLSAKLGPRTRRPVGGYERKTQVETRPISQAHCLVGGPAYSLNDARRIPFFMLNNILGGPGMNSRLNLAVREKYGLVYTIDSTYSPYTDTGLFGIYFGT